MRLKNFADGLYLETRKPIRIDTQLLSQFRPFLCMIGSHDRGIKVEKEIGLRN